MLFELRNLHVKKMCDTFINSTLDSKGLSKRKSNKKFSSIGNNWAN